MHSLSFAMYPPALDLEEIQCSLDNFNDFPKFLWLVCEINQFVPNNHRYDYVLYMPNSFLFTSLCSFRLHKRISRKRNCLLDLVHCLEQYPFVLSIVFSEIECLSLLLSGFYMRDSTV